MRPFDPNQPRPLPPGEIDPEVLTKWFHDALGVLRVDDTLKRFFWDRDISEIQQFLIRSRQELQHFWAYNAPFDPRRVRRLVPRIASFLHKRIERWPGWIPEMVLADIVLDEEQYAALREGFLPGWDCRYATYCYNGNLFLYRSGNILMKFRYTRRPDGLYHMTSCYRTAKLSDPRMLDETLRCGPWRVPLINREEQSHR